MITVDCADPGRLAAFWLEALNARVVQDIQGDFLVLAADEDGVRLGLQRSDQPRPARNLVHFDLGTDERAAEVARLVELGAEEVEEHVHPGMAWTILRDPEGNEFCVGSRKG